MPLNSNQCNFLSSALSDPGSIRTVVHNVANNNHGDAQTMAIAWRNLRLESRNFCGRPKVVLRRLNGHFERGSLNAIMGPSGAGKTTLLNCLTGSGNSLPLTVESELYIRCTRQTVSPSSQPSWSSYFIEQHVHESIIGHLTVGETLRYAYRFKNSGQRNNKWMEEYIQNMIKEFMLDKNVLDRHFDRCSGGEQKRIAICQELMALQKPSFLFVDEPTTGLDSNASLLVMSCLKQLTITYDMTVIVSIHLPNDEILRLFDKLYVLSKGGVCVYSGPPLKLRNYLARKINLHVPENQQPIEALLKLACEGINNADVCTLADYTLHRQYHQVDKTVDQMNYYGRTLSNTKRSFSFYHLVLQFYRMLRITFYAEFKLFSYQVMIYVAYFIILATLFDRSMIRPSGCYSLENATCTSQLERNDLLNENLNYLCFTMLFVGFIVMCTSGVLFSSLVKVFRSEHRNKWYSLGVFYWSASVASMIELCFFVLLNSVLSYFLIGQHAIDQYKVNWYRLGYHTASLWLLSVYMQSFGQLLGVLLMDNIEVAVILCQILYVSLSLMNGFFFNIDQGNNQLFKQVSSIGALKYLTKLLLYTFYYLDRCSAETEVSLVMLEHQVDTDKLIIYVARVLINCVIVRLVTLIFLILKFSTLKEHPIFKCFCSFRSMVTKSGNIIPLDYNLDTNIMVETAPALTDQHIKEQNEVNFDEFARHKISVAWQDLSLYASSSLYEVISTTDHNENQTKLILRNLNGHFRFGTLNALMGTSGAGKTTLLKVLNGRSKTRLDEKTRFYLSKFTKIQTCFLTQEVFGHLCPGLTAKQTLIYASRLKNRHQQSKTRLCHEKIALGLLDELNIKDTVNTVVERCSGGERKRLALAAELTSLQMPNLICIDEPTSGLDSNSAEVVVSCLHKLSRRHNITIVASIHQPNSEVLAMFDQLYVLARGGVCVYSGKPNGIERHLKSVPKLADVSCTYPIEVLIKHSCSNYGDSIVQQLLVNNNHQMSMYDAQIKMDTQLAPDGILLNRCRFSFHSSYVLLSRYLAFVRGYMWPRWLAYIAIYLLYGAFLRSYFEPVIALPSGCIRIDDEDYNNTCIRTPEKVLNDDRLKNNFKYNFFFLNIFLFIVLLQSSLNFCQEIVYFFNEHRNGWYTSGSFYLMKSLTESVSLVPIIMVHIYVCNFYEPVRPGMYWYLVALLTLASVGFQGMAHVFSMISGGNITILTMLSIAIYLLFCLVGGLYINPTRLHYAYKFLSNFSIPRFVFEIALLLQYGFNRCHRREVQIFLYLLELKDEDLLHSARMLLFNLIFYRLLAIWMLVNRANPVENRRQRVKQLLDYQHQLPVPRIMIAGLGSHYKFQIKQIDIS